MAPWSRWLRRYRDDQDLTQEELGEVLGVEGKMVSAWENGQRPGRRHARNLCAQLGTTRSELGLVEPEDGPVMGRRTFLRHSVGIGAMAVFGPWAGLDRLDEAAADGFDATNEVLWHLWARTGAAAALGPALGHVESIGRLLEGSLPSSLRPRLCAGLAEGGALVSALKSWIGDAAGASHFGALAFGAAHDAADPDLAARILLVRTATDRGLHDRTRLRLQRYTEGEGDIAIAGAAAATQGWALAKAADVHAELGQEAAALQALDHAETLLAKAGSAARHFPSPDPRWLIGERGATLARLGRTAEARQALTMALADATGPRAQDRLWLLLATARTHVHDGDPEPAAQIALDVVREARRVQQGQVEDEVRRLHATLPSTRTPSVLALGAALTVP